MLMAGSCAIMIVLGGYVRVTKSGLSIIKWDLSRIFPPRDDLEWNQEFETYKEHLQFKNDFPNMNLQEFKRIYLLEFYHRYYELLIFKDNLVKSLEVYF